MLLISAAAGRRHSARCMAGGIYVYVVGADGADIYGFVADGG